ncbi:nucleotidyltransferase family protein [Salinicoccus halitifaciens]|uniref:Molybdenum cofactor cytidylyltransferase n=1 Tax=Salinicoccus halitifaciens TaxID=1073415 RepID=A0ABV2ECD4_9STAP|nr:nucleotidyltransferase family protein [Salinicoccus halitifaciens]MCD2137359.1 nucleotidyltransferase family protein [Salinicoccus halitifaciens]
MDEKKVCAVVLAAGTSSRMGSLKQLLPLDGQQQLGSVIKKVLHNGFTDVYTVLGHKAEQIKAVLDIPDENHHWLINENYRDGQSTSVKTALQHIMEEYNHVMIFLGDMPFIKDETVETVKNSGRAHCIGTDPFIVRPVYRGMAGHPVFIGNINQDIVAQLDGDSGFKSVKKVFAFSELIETDDAGVNFDVDTEEDYQVALKRAGEHPILKKLK